MRVGVAYATLDVVRNPLLFTIQIAGVLCLIALIPAPPAFSAEAMLVGFKLDHMKTNSEFDRLVEALHESSRSFNFLREHGFDHSDEAFEKMIADNPTVLRSVRIIRRDENGQRVIPGWPGVGLVEAISGDDGSSHPKKPAREKPRPVY